VKPAVPKKLPRSGLAWERLIPGIGAANRALAHYDGVLHAVPNPEILLSPLTTQEAVLSSQIEGTQSSLQDLLAAEAKLSGTESAPSDVGEVINYVGAMRQGLQRLAELPVSVRLIKEIHERLLRGERGGRLESGELRRSQNWIGPGGAHLSEATFVPPPPDVVPEALGAMERFLHQDDQVPLLIKIGLVHAQFETIHPFLDGNGRVGRLLITFLLTERGVLHQPVLYLSHFFKAHRQEYYEQLQAVRDQGAWEEWLAFFLRGVTVVSREAAETARRILQLREEHRALITSHLGRGAGGGHKVLESLYDRPIVSVHDVQRITGTTYPSANVLVDRLVREGILVEITGHARNRRFRYDAYVRLFTDEPVDASPPRG